MTMTLELEPLVCPITTCRRRYDDDDLDAFVVHVERHEARWRACLICGRIVDRRAYGSHADWHRRWDDVEPAESNRDLEPTGPTETVTAAELHPDDDLVTSYGPITVWSINRDLDGPYPVAIRLRGNYRTIHCQPKTKFVRLQGAE